MNVDQTVSALGALMIINDLNKYGPRSLSFGEGEAGSSFAMVDDTSTASHDSDSTNETETEEEGDGNEAEDDETMVDEGPLEEEHEGCHGGRRDPLARFDANEDGLLTVDEVPEMLWERLLVADTDADGAISPTELETIAIEHHRGDPFERFDANEDGALTVDEVPERLWERLSQADADEDGAVTADEITEVRRNAREDNSHHRHHHR